MIYSCLCRCNSLNRRRLATHCPCRSRWQHIASLKKSLWSNWIGCNFVNKFKFTGNSTFIECHGIINHKYLCIFFPYSQGRFHLHNILIQWNYNCNTMQIKNCKKILLVTADKTNSSCSFNTAVTGAEVVYIDMNIVSKSTGKVRYMCISYQIKGVLSKK